MTQSTKNFLKAYYAYAFLFDFILCYAIYTAFFEVSGLSYFQIGMLLAFWSGSALVFEIFTGALSDWLDRRWLLIAAPLIKILTFVCWGVADGNVWVYGLGFGFWSLAGALFSGTGEALLFERLQAEKSESHFDRVYGRASAAESIGVGAGLLFGGFVAASSMELSIWLSIPPLILAAGTAFLLTDIRQISGEGETRYLDSINVAFAEFRKIPELRFVTIYIAVGLIIFGELEEFDQLYYLAVNLPFWLFGVAGAIGLLLHAIASLHAHRFSTFSSFAWLLPALGGILFLIASLGDSPYFVIVLEAAYLVSIPPLILSQARFQHLIESHARATTTSMLEFVQNISALLLALGFGALANSVGILSAYGWAGIFLLLISAWVYWKQSQGNRAF